VTQLPLPASQLPLPICGGGCGQRLDWERSHLIYEGISPQDKGAVKFGVCDDCMKFINEYMDLIDSLTANGGASKNDTWQAAAARLAFLRRQAGDPKWPDGQPWWPAVESAWRLGARGAQLRTVAEGKSP
jgi:hypothetical protein